MKARKLLTILIILVLTLLLAVTSTFSWYNRTARANDESYLLKYSQTGKVNNGSNIKIETFSGANNNGVISYSETALLNDSSITTKSGELSYFKTVITDESNSGDSLVSLYYTQLTCSSNIGNKFNIGIIGPEKTNKQFTKTATSSDFVVNYLLVEDNLLVKNNSKIEVYWFIQVDNTYTGDGTITLGTPYVVNN